MGIYSFPTSAVLRKIAQEKVPVLTLNDPIFQHFPIRTENADTVLWEQKDNYTGLQSVRGIGGQFGVVKQVGMNRYSVIPGYYGDKYPIDEQKLTRLRQEGTFGTAIDAAQLVLEGQEYLLNREIDGMRVVAWSMTGGRFARVSATGAVLHTDVFSIQSMDSTTTTINGQTVTPMSNWSNYTTGTPLADLRQLKIAARGRGVRFDKSAVMYCNLNTANWLLNNNNTADLRGKVFAPMGNGSSSVLTIDHVNEILLAQDLPKLVIHDDGYIDDATNTFIPFIPDGELRVMGSRADGNQLGGIVETRNASNEGQAPGPYDDAVESPEPPKTITVYRGVNYAPIIEYPGSVIRCRVNGTAFPALQ